MFNEDLTPFKQIAQAAFKSRYSTEPNINDITIIGFNLDGTELLFKIGYYTYKFNSYIDKSGKVYTGKETIKNFSL